MARYTRKSAILAKLEVTYGTDPVPTGGSNAMQVSNQNVTPLQAENVDRALLREYFGASEHLVGVASVALSFDVDLAASGTLGLAPAWDPLIRACGTAKTLTADTLVEYRPETDSPASTTIYYHDDGVLHKLLGARGDVVMRLNLAGKPVLAFSFTGLYGGVVEAANPATTLTAFQQPLVVMDANTNDIKLGPTYSAGALTGGTAYPSRGLELAVGNTVSHAPLLGDESVDITGRESTATFALSLTAAQEVAQMAQVRANTLQSLGFIHGTTAGNIVVLHAPAMQLTNPRKEEYNGRRLTSYDARLLPVSGDDEWVLALR